MEGEENQAEKDLLIANFQSLSAEGDLLLQKGAFHEAIQVFSKALDIKSDDKHCLVARSRCFIQIGCPQDALKDANASLKNDPAYYKGIYLKAEALYAEGDFELALLYFHRGNKLRPELYEFRVGILKSREAINNSIGDPKRMKIRVNNKLRRTLQTLGEQGKDPSSAESKRAYATSAHLSSGMEGKLLEEMYDDKLYLQGLLHDRDFQDFPDDHVQNLVAEGLKYLNTRIGFWRQQNPLYARKREVKIVPRMILKSGGGGVPPLSANKTGATAPSSAHNHHSSARSKMIRLLLIGFDQRMSESPDYFSNNIMINCRLDSISTSEKEPKIKLNPTKRDQLLSLNQDQTLVDLETNVENVCPDPNTCLDTDVENICSLQIVPPRDFSSGHSDCSDCSSEKVDFVGQRKIDFLESKISLLELLLDAKTIKINEQAVELSKLKEVHDTFNTSEQLATENEQDTTVLQLKKKQEQLLKESIELEESRIIAASFNHAESLYLNKLEQLECQIALERMGANDQPPTRLFPITGSVPVEQLEQTLISIQKLLKLEPNISNEGLELLLNHLQKTLDESNQIIELQHSKLQQVLDEQNQSSAIVTSPSLVLAKELIKIIRSLSSSNDESSNYTKMKQISLSLLQVIKKEARFLESSCLRLEDQLAINFEIKRLLVSLQVEKKNTELVVRLNDVLHENADLRQQLHISADYQNTINLV